MSTLFREYTRAPLALKVTFLAAGLATLFLLSLASMSSLDLAPPRPAGAARPCVPAFLGPCQTPNSLDAMAAGT